MKIELQNVTYSYSDTEKVLENFNLTVNDGEFVCILGHNGSGKSTLAKIIMGLLEPNQGQIVIDGEKLTEDNYEQIRKRMGIIFQNPDNQFVGVTVQDDIAFGLENLTLPREEMIKRVDEYLKLVGMESFKNVNPEELSGGQKQRVAIAGAMAMETNLLIFDEATSMLDPKGTKEVNEMIKAIKTTHHKTIICITHDLIEAINADRVIVLNNGKLVADGSPEEVFKLSDVLKNSGLKTLDSISLYEELKNLNFNNKKRIEEALWKLSFEM